MVMIRTRREKAARGAAMLKTRQMRASKPEKREIFGQIAAVKATPANAGGGRAA